MAICSVEEAVEEIRQGRMIILVDDEDRENEGDITIAAEHVTPEAINFMARYARGLICLSLGPSLVDKLELPLMTQRNGSRFGTNFTVSIEARSGVTTGISAADRAHTIQVAVADDARPGDLVTPGHVFPLRAQPGGVLTRAGQTEGSVDLALLAGLKPAAVICDTDCLETLSPEVFADGAAEAVKTGVLCDEGLFALFEDGTLKADPAEVIARCVEIKRDVVQQDEFDTGVRGLLNFGHTIGHAVEKCSDFAVSHGRAVAIGMALITKAAYLAGICEKACVDEMFALLRQYGLPVSTKFAAEELLSAMRSDKKRAGNSITLVLPEAIGKCRLEKLPVEEMRAFLCPALEDQTWM